MSLRAAVGNPRSGFFRFSAMEDRKFWMMVRQGLLLILDALERKIEIEPRTAQIRREYKAQQ